MMRIEIKTIVELPDPVAGEQPTPHQVLEGEIERAAEDPITYLQTHLCYVSIRGSMIDGPIASDVVEKAFPDSQGFLDTPLIKTLEPRNSRGS
jgi:hypothetical protein